jgi:hypothetical protein
MTPPAATKIFCATSEVDKVDVMLLAASNGLNSDGPMATTPRHHLQCVQAICLALDACLSLQLEVDTESSDEDDDKELASQSLLVVAVGTASHPPHGQLCDSAVVFEGLGSLSLSLSPVTSRGPICEVPPPPSAQLPPLSLLWDASLSHEDDYDEVFAP